MIRCFVNKYSLLCASDESSIKYAIDKKMKEINKEDDSLEETTLKGIISSCENMLDDLEESASISDKDMQDIIYADNVLLEIQQRLASSFTPTNIEGGHYSADGNFTPMSDRIYCDDEHGNCM